MLLYSFNAHRRTECLAPSIVHDIGWPKAAAIFYFHQINIQCTFSQLFAAGGPRAGRGLATPGLVGQIQKKLCHG